MNLAKSARDRGVRHLIQVTGQRVAYFEYPAKAPNAKTLVMVHGYRGNHHGLEAIAAGLGNYRVLIPDLPGFGESEALSIRHSVENYSRWLRTFVSELNLSDELHLMGHSFGTLIVGHFATEHVVRSVTLVNPVSTPALQGPRALLTSITKIYYRVASLAPAFLGKWLLRSHLAVMVMSIVMAKTKDKNLRRWIHKQHLTHFSDFASVRVAVEGYYASISTDLSQFARQISAPVLIIAAELDDITDITSQRRVFQSYENAVLREISGVGHLVHYEAPDRAASHIVSFLGEL
jgi:pimeloyl-ACP methyl ester carboxylesterase